MQGGKLPTYLRPLCGSRMLLLIVWSVALPIGLTFRWSAFLLRMSGKDSCSAQAPVHSAAAPGAGRAAGSKARFGRAGALVPCVLGRLRHADRERGRAQRRTYPLRFDAAAAKQDLVQFGRLSPGTSSVGVCRSVHRTPRDSQSAANCPGPGSTRRWLACARAHSQGPSCCLPPGRPRAQKPHTKGGRRQGARPARACSTHRYVSSFGMCSRKSMRCDCTPDLVTNGKSSCATAHQQGTGRRQRCSNKTCCTLPA